MSDTRRYRRCIASIVFVVSTALRSSPGSTRNGVTCGQWKRQAATAGGYSALDFALVSSRPITDQLVQEIADDLRARYALDDDDVRALGARLAANERDERRAENIAFAERFSAEHHETLDRLGR